MLDILFVVPSSKPALRQESNGTLLLATILKQKSINTDICRFHEADMTQGFNSFVNETVQNILTRKPCIVSFYCRCDCFLANIKIAEKLKEADSNIIIIFGGPQADALSLETISTLPFVDYCCSGEGETTIYPLVKALLAKEDTTHIAGLTYRTKDGQVKENPRPALIKDINDLPHIDYSIIPADIMDAEKNPEILIETGRGCPFNCAYCSSSIFWQRTFRSKSPERIVDEIENLYNSYGFRVFTFPNDLFAVNKKQVMAFCEELKKRQLDIRWICSSRVDTLDEEVIRCMAQAGLKKVFLGIESGSERIQKAIHKNINRDKVLEICRTLKKYGVTTVSSFMYGFPDETEADLELTAQLASEIYSMGLTQIQFHLCAILPGTEFYNTYKDELSFAQTQSNIVGDFGVAENMDFINEHLELFPFYFEYSSPLRKDFACFEDIIPACLFLYSKMIFLHNENFSNISLLGLYKDIYKANRELFTDSTRKPDNYSLIFNYLSANYSGETLQKLLEIFSFEKTLSEFKKEKQMTFDARSFSIDIRAYQNKKTLSEITAKPVMVYFQKKGRKLSFIIKDLG